MPIPACLADPLPSSAVYTDADSDSAADTCYAGHWTLESSAPADRPCFAFADNSCYPVSSEAAECVVMVEDASTADEDCIVEHLDVRR